MLDRLEAAIIGTPGYTELRWHANTSTRVALRQGSVIANEAHRVAGSQREKRRANLSTLPRLSIRGGPAADRARSDTLRALVAHSVFAAQPILIA
jgi:hypothetical protein